MPRISALPQMSTISPDDEIPIVDVSEATTKKFNPSMLLPTGTIVDFAGTSAPTGWILCYGQALNASSNPQYQDLYDVIGNTYGGSSNTNFVVPDLRGRVISGKDDMGGSSANRLTAPSTANSINGDTLGATGGHETHTILTAELAQHGHSINDPQHTHGLGNTYGTGMNGGGAANRAALAGGSAVYFGSVSTFGASTGITINGNGSDTPHNNVQPTIILNKIIKY